MTAAEPLVIRRAAVEGTIHALSDVRLERGRVAQITPHRSGPAETNEMDACGGALMPGLHDHHVHLAATAASWNSVDLGSPAIRSAAHMTNALRDRGASVIGAEWIRAVGYHESVAGDLDRDVLDRMVADHPVRVQHRSGAAWFVNTAGLRRLGVEPGSDRPVGLEVDDDGRPTGRLFRLDTWLRERIGPSVPDLGPLATALAAAGVTGCTDATPWETEADRDAFRTALTSSAVPQHVRWMTAPGVSGGLATKVVVGDHELPAYEDLERWFAQSHEDGLPVAVHVVSAVALALVLAAWTAVGVVPGDRIEHGAVVPVEALGVLAELGVSVVTQPGIVAARGESYLRDVEADEVPLLWRCGSFIRAGVPVGGSSDAPYGPLDPWIGIAAAVTRLTSSGVVLGADERIAPRRALDLYLGPLEDPGGPARRVVVNAPADLCLLDGSLEEVLVEPSRERVCATLASGRVVFAR